MVVVVVTLPRDVGRIGSAASPVVDIEVVLVGSVDEGVELDVVLVEELEVLIELDREVEVDVVVEIEGVLPLVEVEVVEVLVLVVGEAVTVGFTITVDVVLRRPDSISKFEMMQRNNRAYILLQHKNNQVCSIRLHRYLDSSRTPVGSQKTDHCMIVLPDSSPHRHPQYQQSAGRSPRTDSNCLVGRWNRNSKCH